MPRMGFPIVGFIVGALAPLAVGCGGGPTRIPNPPFDASGATSRLFSQADANKDGDIDRKEALKAPSVLHVFKEWDKNGDGKISQAEATAAFKYQVDSRMPLVQPSIKVSVGGQPFVSGEIRFVPEPFMGPGFHPAVGRTDDRGYVSVAAAGELLPGVRCGMYRIEASKTDGGKEALPAKYNTETVYGYEVRLGNSQGIVLDLN